MKPLTVFHAMVLVAVLGGFAAAQQVGDRQFYTKWKPQKGSSDQWICRYCYKTNPNSNFYEFQFVVWNRQWPERVAFFRSNNKYWCIAPLDPAKENHWNVLAKGKLGKMVDRLEEIKIGEEDFPHSPPPIPNTENTEMIFPSFEGLPTDG